MISALRDLALTSIQLVEQRLRLLGAELQEEKWRAVERVAQRSLVVLVGRLGHTCLAEHNNHERT